MTTTPTATAPPAPLEQQAVTSAAAAALLAFTGGLLDVFLYLDHGGVFAGAMTGNVVLCGAALLSGKPLQILHHFLPVAAFCLGIWAAEVVQGRVKHHAPTIALGLEAGGLLVASFLPGSFPDPAFVFLIALLAAFQVGTFRKADSYSYSSTFVTGDLRTMMTALYQALDPAKRRESSQEFRDLALIVITFVGGAVTGALVSRSLGNHTLWLAVLVLAVVFGLALRRSLAGHGAAREAGAP